jgi:hypothetical protein
MANDCNGATPQAKTGPGNQASLNYLQTDKPASFLNAMQGFSMSVAPASSFH